MNIFPSGNSSDFGPGGSQTWEAAVVSCRGVGTKPIMDDMDDLGVIDGGILVGEQLTPSRKVTSVSSVPPPPSSTVTRSRSVPTVGPPHSETLSRMDREKKLREKAADTAKKLLSR